MFFFVITGPREVQADWQRVPSQGRVSECKDLSSAIVLARHASCTCTLLFLRFSVVKTSSFGSGQFAEVDDLKEAICSAVALSQV